MKRLVFFTVVACVLALGLWALPSHLAPPPEEAKKPADNGTLAVDPWAQVLAARPRRSIEPPVVNRSIVRLPGEEEHDSRDHFTQQLLRLALDRTVPTYGPYKMVIGEPINRLRAFAEVLDGKLDVTWSVSTQLRESFLLPVRTEISKGMHGYRLLLIRKGDQERFSRVQNLADLRRLLGGAGHDWQPTEVWRANDLPLITSDSYQSLFPMLTYKRFDYIPRALFEPWLELAEHPQLPLAVEDSLLIHYHAANYFFVHPSRVDLAQRIAAGLDAAMADGSFDELLLHFYRFAQMRSQLHVRSRRLIEISNPFLIAAPSPAKSRFWFSPNELLQQFP